MNKKHTKRAMVAIILAFTLLSMFCFPIGAMASEIEQTTVQPRWTSISSIDVCIAFDGTDGNVAATAIKQATASSIKGTLVLYKKVGSSWEYMDEWSGSKSRGTLALSGDFTAVGGVTYKAVFTVTAYTNGVGETETVEYIKTC